MTPSKQTSNQGSPAPMTMLNTTYPGNHRANTENNEC